jgi:hypothetical protein
MDRPIEPRFSPADDVMEVQIDYNDKIGYYGLAADNGF